MTIHPHAALLVLLSPAAARAPSSDTSAPSPPPLERAAFLLKSYNVNFGLSGDPDTLAAVGAGEPDLVLLQETTPAWERALRAAYGTTYPHQDFLEGPGAGGLGVLSRHPITTEEILISPVGWFPAWLLTVGTPAGAIQILQVHLKPPYAERGGWLVGLWSTPRERRQEIEAYLPYLDPALPTVVCGDFNERGGPALDAARAAGLRDALPPGADTWRWRVAGIDLAAPLDHVLYGAGLRPVSAEVQALGRSDHLPVLVGFARE